MHCLLYTSALPILLVLTILTAIVTIVGSLLGGAHIWGYYPGKIWSQLICLFLLIPVKIEGREKLHDKTSYIFVPNHQGSFDIFLIYGFIGRNFKMCIRDRLSDYYLTRKTNLKPVPKKSGTIHLLKESTRSVFHHTYRNLLPEVPTYRVPVAAYSV